jgi:hypothetical protein
MFMTNEQKHIRLLEFMGWKKHTSPHFWWAPYGVMVAETDLPPLTLDLLHEAEEKLSAIGYENSKCAHYQENLWSRVNPGISFEQNKLFDVAYLHNLIHATKEQRLDAFSDTIGEKESEMTRSYRWARSVELAAQKAGRSFRKQPKAPKGVRLRGEK